MKINLGIVGATGLVGQTILKVLSERKIEFDHVYLYASKKSAGTKIEFNGEEISVLELSE